MDEFNNVNQTPQQNGDGYIPPQQNNGAAPSAPQDAEPRTPYQTPVQHPAYQAPQQEQQPPQDGQPGGAGKPPKKKGHGKAVVIGLCGVGAACLLFAGGALLGTFAFSGGADPAADGSAAGPLPTVQIADTPKLDPDNYDVVNGLAGEEIYKKVSPSIVSVIAETPNGTGTGSGVIMTADGYVITNNHVVEGAAQVTVQLSEGDQLAAEVIGTDEQTDLAVLKVTPEGELAAAEFGDSDALQPGEYAYALGSPGGVQFANTITGGRISAINRDVTINDRVMTLIQTDASINPGNSGGALINKYGQVVGITSAKLSGNAFSAASIEGMGFAIPINTAKEIVDELIANGYVTGRPSIGISGYDVESADGSIAGMQVDSIDSRAKAADEGLQVGDVIVAVDGTPTPTMNDVNEVKEDKKAGDKITLTVYRLASGKRLNVTITLMDAHDLEGADPAAQQEAPQQEQGGGYYSPFPFFGW
ncbi:MAG: S1C family serine protease [Agathobaculum desmolans]|uniref:S1C family serine protease n=1 Tax=Agathobaculum desmolans TaxID=39484 RepID=UPI003994F5C4